MILFPAVRKLPPKSGHELRTSVRDDRRWGAIVPIEPFQEQASKITRSSPCGGEADWLLNQPTHDDKDRIIAGFSLEDVPGIHGNTLPRSLRHRQRLKVAWGPVARYLCVSACRAVLHSPNDVVAAKIGAVQPQGSCQHRRCLYRADA